MKKFPCLSALELVRVIKKIGFEFIRQKGSHMFFRYSDGRTTIIPNHLGEKIGKGLLIKIIKKDFKLLKEEFFKFLNN
ncbi:type II toxin-antitoxin system HicA family toxin [Nanoarchaeota archaeon]